MPGAVNVALRWTRAGGGASSIAAGIGNAVAVGLTAGVTPGGPALITAPSISTIYSATATSNEVLRANVGTYEKQNGVELTGTYSSGDLISRPATDKAVIYIGSNANASAVTGAYNGWFLLIGGMGYLDGIPLGGIYSYDGTTKQATIRLPSAATPTAGSTWRLIKNYPVLRKGQWKRNGVAIADAKTRVYAVTPSDVGQPITYEETVGFTDPTYVQYGPTSVTPPVPTTSTTATSASYTPTSSITSTTKIVGASDFTYIGSFKSPVGNNEGKISVVPASQSQNGQVSILVIGSLGGNYVNEISIPTLSTSSDPASLNTGTVTRSANDISDGWGSPDKTGMGTISGGTCALSGTSNLVASCVSYYSYAQQNYFVKRPADITLTPTLNPFCVYPTNQSSARGRWAGGSICEIPAALQSSLGGDLLSSSGVVAIAAANSQQPAGMVYSSSDIDGAVAKYETGTTASSGTTTTAFLAATASSTPNYYLNWQVVFSISGSTYNNTAYITAYNSTTKQITFASFGTSVPAGATYSLIAPVFAKQVYGNADSPAELSNDFPSLWTSGGGSFTLCAFVPKGTTSFVSVTNVISQSMYGLWATVPDSYGSYWGGMGLDGNGIYSRLYTAFPEVFSSPGPRGPTASLWADSTSNFILFWVYDAADLASVVSGAKTYNQITPSAVFSFALPYSGQGLPSAAFDNINNRLYVYQLLSTNNGTFLVIHVYSCSKYA